MKTVDVNKKNTIIKDKLLVSFSGGETSAYMGKWLIENKSDQYEMVFVFANTGQENEETLNFVNICDKIWNLNVVWVEAKVNPEKGKGTRHRIVDYQSAARNGEPFEEVIKKYGIPNQNFPHCNRELKLNPIHSYIKSIGWENYYTAIGIRADEFDRINAKNKELKLIYPLISDNPMTKQKINNWWNKQGFRLNLTSYEGNCKTCWKKSFKNLMQISKKHPSHFDFFRKMELQHNNTFFRGAKSVNDIFDMANKWTGKAHDYNADLNYQIDLFDADESCDIYSNCGL